MFSIKNGWKTGDVFRPLLFNFVLEYVIRKVQLNQIDLKLNGTRQLLVYAFGVNILGGNVHNMKKNAHSLVVVSMEIGLEVIFEKTTYMVMFRYKNAARSHNIKIDNSSFERVEEFKCLGTTLTHQNSIQDEIKGKMISGNACYHSVQMVAHTDGGL